MPRPSRANEAKEKLRAYYAEHGGMPSAGAFAELMGYASASTANDVAKVLVEQGFLVREERGRRLLPGPKFGSKRAATVDIPLELLAALPKGVELVAWRVPKGSGVVSDGVLPGDYLLLAPESYRELSCTYLLTRRKQKALSSTLIDGWRIEAVVVGQFRKY